MAKRDNSSQENVVDDENSQINVAILDEEIDIE
jgi:hypothetical protein